MECRVHSLRDRLICEGRNVLLLRAQRIEKEGSDRCKLDLACWAALFNLRESKVSTSKEIFLRLFLGRIVKSMLFERLLNRG